MPNIRIKDIPTTAPATVSGDFFAVDSSASTRKLDAFSPTFGGNAAVTGTLTVSGASAFFGSNTGSPYVLIKGGSSGTNGGGSLVVENGSGGSVIGIGNVSAIAGGAYNNDPVLWYAGSESLRIYNASTEVANFSSTGLFTLLNQLKVSNGSVPDLWLQNTAGANSAYRNVLFRQNSNGTFKLLTTSDAGVLTLDNILVGDNATGTLLFGTATNSNNGRLQLASHTASSGGIGFGTDISLYRSAANTLALDTTGNAAVLNVRENGTLTAAIGTVTGDLYLQTQQAGKQVYIKTANAATAATFDSSQNATFAKDVLLGTNGPSVPSTLSGRAPRQGLVFDGTAGVSANATIAALGTSPLTYEAVFYVPLTAGVGQGVMYVGTASNSVAGNSGAVYLEASGTLRVIFRTDNSNYSIADIGSFQQNNAGKFVHFALVRPSSGNPVVYINGIAQSLSFSGAGAPAGGWQMNLTGTNAVLNLTDGSATAGTTILSPRIYNRALSAVEVRQLYENGAPAAEDLGIAGSIAPSNTTLTTSAVAQNFAYDTFSSTTNSFSAVETGGQACEANFISGTTFLGRAPRGARFLVSFTATLTSGATPSVRLSTQAVAGTSSAIVNVVNGSNSIILQLIEPFTAETGTGAGRVTFATGSNTNYSISNLVVTRLGTVLAPDATQTGGGLTWYDTSGNGANITLSASGVAWNVPTSGNVTSAGQLNLRAGGTNSNIFIAPTGTGAIRLGGTTTANLWSDSGLNLAIGTASGGSGLTFLTGSQNALFGKATDAANGRVQLADHTTLTGGIGLGSGTAIYNDGTAGVVRVQKVGGGGFGALHLYSDTQLRASLSYNSTDGYVDAPVGNLIFRTSGTVTALTINSSQNSVFAGNVAVQGSVSSDGVNGNALFGGAKRVIIGYDTTADVGNIAAVHTGTAWKALALQPLSGAVLIGKTSDTGNGRLQFVEGTTAQNGIQFGTDTNLYRSAANTLKTDDVFQAAGGMSSGSYVGGQDLYLNNAAGTVRSVYWQTAGVSRWALYTNNTAESGSNLGSNLTLSRYTDAGAYVGDPLSIDRATGTVLFGSASVAQTLSANGQVGMTVTNNNAGTNAFASYQTWNGTTGLNIVTWGSAFTGRTNENWIYSVGAYPLRFGTDSTIRMMLTSSSGNLLIGTATDSSNGKLQLATHTAYTGGIGFGTDASFYRYQAGGLALDHTNGTAPALMWRETGTSTLRIETNSQVGYISTLTANSLILRTNSITALTLDSSQNATFAGTIRTAAPVGGTAASWKLGTVATVSPTSPNRTIEVDIGGTIYYIHAKTTNN